jgi:phosphoglycolate phosphatase
MYFKQNILFDLDGTLTDPKEGITKSMAFALDKVGHSVDNPDSLAQYIGPPLQLMFAEILGAKQGDRVAAAMTAYRQRFSDIGKFENFVYPEVPCVLNLLQQKGKKLFVATSKPQVFAEEIVEHFKLRQYFQGVYGSELTGERSDKGDLIRHILTQEKLAADDTIMIGDRKHDAVGAIRHGVKTIGVSWGYGSIDELQNAGVDRLVLHPSNLLDILLPPANSVKPSSACCL